MPARRNSSANRGMSKWLELKPAKSQPLKAACNVFEQRGILYLLVGDASDSDYFRGNGATRIDKLVDSFLTTIKIHLDIGNLDDTVFYKIKPRCLQVEDNQGLCKV